MCRGRDSQRGDPPRRPGWRRWLAVGLAVPLLLAGSARPAAAQQRERPLVNDFSKVDPDLKWLNTAGPLRMQDLRGKIVLLDFWTFCCINCINTLPELAKLEKKYANQLVVIGVHSGKFENEKNTENIRKAILRYEITHPVVNDANMRLWRYFGVEAWPTLVLIDPDGRYVDAASGEGNCPAADKVIANLIKTYRAKGTLNEKPMRFELARKHESGDSPLFFPGKVLADGPGRRLFIADSTHHRIVITDLSGKKIAVAGDGEPGHKDGAFTQAEFNDPQGMALRRNVLYVADRKNHRIRALDLKAKTVKTIAGTGVEDRQLWRSPHAGHGLEIALNSPWDLCFVGDTLYIAMAGAHQIWSYDLRKDFLRRFAGSGQEEIHDGRATSAAFAQPSGLATDGTHLYVADSEVSAVRSINLENRTVRTIVGTGLFDFGDQDGTGRDVRLQHCIGIAYHDGRLYVADTYNSKIKVIDPERRSARTFVGGEKGDDRPFYEPAGLNFDGDTLYVADTNAHRIQVVDLRTRKVHTLELKGVTAPGVKGTAAPASRPSFPNATRTTLKPAAVPEDGELTLEIGVPLANGFKLNPLAEMQYLIEALPAGKNAWSETKSRSDKKAAFALKVPLAKLARATALRVSLAYSECAESNEGVCRLKSHIWEIPLRFGKAEARRTIQLGSRDVTTVDKE
jgi:DNA-binding beta-propeller fold protein YncE